MIPFDHSDSRQHRFKMKCCGRKTCYFILFVVGVVFIVLPFALNGYINDTIRKTIDRNVVIKPGSQIYDEWRKPNLPIYLKIHTFSIMNTAEVKKGKPPVVLEKGPYSYKENREKFNISWGNESTVTYNQVTKYVFDSEASCASCHPSKDKVTTFNIPFITVTQLIKQLNTSDFLGWKEVLSKFLNIIDDDIFIEKTVNETIWGYVDPLFKQYNDFRTALLHTGIPFIKNLAKKLPVIPTVFVLQPNPSYDGVTTVKTGRSIVDDVGLYKEWKGHKVLPYWNSKIANILNGTDGSIYKPQITKDDVLYIFVTQLCRSMHLIHYSDDTIQGIPALRFHPPMSVFQSGNINPNNKGFCVPNCLPSGLLSIKPCLPLPAPIMASSPHFLNGDPILRKKVLGLHPNEEKHDTFVHVEPNTGILLQASKRLQFNLHVERVDGFSSTYGLTPTAVPIMWVNEHVTIDSKNAGKLKTELMILTIIKWVKIGLIILGSVLVVIALLLFGRLCWQSKNGRISLVEVVRNGNLNHDENSDHRTLNPSLINASD